MIDCLECLLSIHEQPPGVGPVLLHVAVHAGEIAALRDHELQTPGTMLPQLANAMHLMPVGELRGRLEQPLCLQFVQRLPHVPGRDIGVLVRDHGEDLRPCSADTQAQKLIREIGQFDDHTGCDVEHHLVVIELEQMHAPGINDRWHSLKAPT